MKKKVIIPIILVLFCIVGMSVYADTTFNSKGKIEFGNDVVFDASDLEAINSEIQNGKTNVATAINAYPDTDIGTFPTFDEIVNGINNLTTVPTDTYFYDKTTISNDASTLKRYKKVDDIYYECDKNGILLDNDADTVTDSNLVAYTTMDETKVNIGKTGYVDGQLILGDEIVKANIITLLSNADSSYARTVSVTAYPEYPNFTTDNFIVRCKALYSAENHSGWHTLYPSVSYDPSTGIVSVSSFSYTYTANEGAHYCTSVSYDIVLVY